MIRMQHFQKYQFWYVVGLIAIYLLINNTINATSVIMEARRRGPELPFQLWEPFVWEYSSALATLILFPAINWLTNYEPIRWQNLKRVIPAYFIASVIFSIAHVAGMVALRKLVYFIEGGNYDFGNFWFEMIYEYRKDLWSFLFFVCMIYGYRFIVSRILGEANIVANGEDEQKDLIFDRILVKKLGKEFIIKVSDIEWLESSGNYVNLHINSRIYPTRSTLSSLVDKISDKGFCRIHRSYAVNLDAVESITPLASGDSEIKLTNGKVLNLSRRYKDQLKLNLH